MTKGIERKFEKRFQGILQIVEDYEDFKKFPKGASLWIIGSDNREFFAYLEEYKFEEDLKCQKILLQYHLKSKNKRKTIVGEFYLPLEGKIDIRPFLKTPYKTYQVD